ncbi:MAG: hypothetical protein FJZ90_06300 [Chloroflexi bacterium]|nr:hypothetical protein [Chloroflexota bacterium]
MTARRRRDPRPPPPPARDAPKPVEVDPSALEQLPSTYQAVQEYYARFPGAKLFALRKEAFQRIEHTTDRPLVCYVTKTTNIPREMPAYLDHSDLPGFRDLVQAVKGDELDVFLVSNGGSAEAVERIAKMLRERFRSVRFIVPANAYSAATLLCFAGDEIIMGSLGTLGPIDPQINGIPARTILRAFENIEERLKREGPAALTAYVPLLEKYDLHMLEICKSAQELSQELARNFLSEHMLKCDKDDPRIARIVRHFSDYDVQKSHARSIDRRTARDWGLTVTNAEDVEGLDPLVYSLYNQYEFFFDRTPFYKLFENAMGITWGRQSVTLPIKLPASPAPEGPARPVSSDPSERSS